LKHLIRMFFVVSILSSAGICIAADTPGDPLVKTLMRASGLDRQIEQLPALVQMGISAQQQETQHLPADEYKRILALAKASFDATTMKNDVAGHIKANMSGKDITAALGWLESPLGRKITALEESASTPEAYAEMHSMGPKLIKDYEGTSRLGKISRFDQATLATDRAVNLAADVQLALLTALSASMTEGIRPSYADLQEAVRKMKAELRKPMAELTALQFMYTYRTLTESEIDQYIAFADSDAGKRYHRVTYAAVHDAVTRSARKFGARLGVKMEKV